MTERQLSPERLDIAEPLPLAYQRFSAEDYVGLVMEEAVQKVAIEAVEDYLERSRVLGETIRYGLDNLTSEFLERYERLRDLPPRRLLECLEHDDEWERTRLAYEMAEVITVHNDWVRKSGVGEPIALVEHLDLPGQSSPSRAES